jgi:hypothetical protein
MRAFSHLASHPKEVPHWSPLQFDQLDAPVLCDRRSLEVLHGHDISILVDKKNLVVHAIEYTTPKPKGSGSPRPPRGKNEERL